MTISYQFVFTPAYHRSRVHDNGQLNNRKSDYAAQSYDNMMIRSFGDKEYLPVKRRMAKHDKTL